MPEELRAEGQCLLHVRLGHLGEMCHAHADLSNDVDAVFISKNDRLYRPPYARERNTTAYNNYVPYFICSVSCRPDRSLDCPPELSASAPSLFQATNEKLEALKARETMHHLSH